LDIQDLAGVSEPTKKLIKVISDGIGSVFRPRSMRNEADAKAYEIRVIAAAEADATVIRASGQVLADLERIKTLANENADIIDRAKIRLLSREIEGQKNVEAIAEHALQSLADTMSDQPVSNDWRRKFFLEAENVCDEDLQFLWGKVLAGEVVAPGSYSLRTLEILKHLSKQEAELFHIACSLAFRDGWIMKPNNDAHITLGTYGLNYPNILSLRDAGLLHEGDSLNWEYPNLEKTPNIQVMNNGLRMQISGTLPQTLKFPAIPFTRAGKELQNLIENNLCMPYLQSAATYLRQIGLTVKKETVLQNGSTTIYSYDEDL